MRPATRLPSSFSRLGVVAIAIVVVVGIGWIDLLTGPEFGLSLFLAIPVFLVADRIGPMQGAIVAAVSVAVWIEVQVLAAPAVPSAGLVAWNASVRAVLFGVLVALADMRRKLVNERWLASTDSLTGIANRRLFDEVLTREIVRVRRSSRPVTVACIDCDNFKAINDRYGHSTGNSLLCVVATTLKSAIREVDLAARIGGDEFAMLLIEADAEQARDVMNRVRVALAAAMAHRGWSVTFSIGALTTTEPPATGDEALHEADNLMYRAKRGGKNALIHDVRARLPSPIESHQT